MVSGGRRGRASKVVEQVLGLKVVLGMLGAVILYCLSAGLGKERKVRPNDAHTGVMFALRIRGFLGRSTKYSKELLSVVK